MRSDHEPSSAELAQAFAALLSRDGKGTVYGPQNGETHGTHELLEALALAERTPGHAVFIRVRSDVLALDADDAERAQRALDLVDVMRARGLGPVVVQSGASEERRHIVVRVTDSRLRRELIEAARHDRIDVRETIRPPLSPHRLGGRSRLVEPSDPLDALCRLAPTSAPPAPLRGLDRELLQRGDSEGRRFPRKDGKPGPDRSAAEASLALRLVRRRYSDASIRSLLLDKRNAAGAKARELMARSKEEGDRYIDGLCRSAREKLRASPTARRHPEVDAACERMISALAMRPEWRGRRGSALFVTFRILIERARQAGTLHLKVSSRELAEALGVEQTTAATNLRDLAALGVVERVSRGGGRWAAGWRLIVPALDERRARARHQLGSTHFSYPPSGGPVGEVSASSDAVGEVRDSESSSGRASRAAARSPVISASLTHWVFPDVFGPRGWFGTHGLGHQAAAALLLVEEAAGRPVAEGDFVAWLGRDALRLLDELCARGLLARDGTGLRRGRATLEEVAATLGTLGTRTWRRARHEHERAGHRAQLADRDRARRPRLPQEIPPARAGRR